MITKYKKGSITVEAIIVVPIVLMVTVITLYMVILLYEQNLILSEVHRVADQVAEHYNPKYLLIEDDTGVQRYIQNSGYATYWRFSNREDAINDAISRDLYYNSTPTTEVLQDGSTAFSGMYPELKEHMILGGDVKIILKYNHGFFGSSIDYAISKEYQLPFTYFLRNATYDGTYTVSETVNRKLREPAEFIRNIDLGGDLVIQIPGVSRVVNKYIEIIDNIKAYIAD